MKRNQLTFSPLKIATVKILVFFFPIICVMYIFIDIITVLHVMLTLIYSPINLTWTFSYALNTLHRIILMFWNPLSPRHCMTDFLFFRSHLFHLPLSEASLITAASGYDNPPPAFFYHMILLEARNMSLSVIVFPVHNQCLTLVKYFS